MTNRQSLLGSLSDFGLPSNANVFGVFVNCNWAVNVRLAINGNFYAYQIATVSNDATFTLNFVVAYKKPNLPSMRNWQNNTVLSKDLILLRH